MKLSILIPTYNYDCSHLVLQLLEQLPEDAEIIVGDDCSAEAIQLTTTDERVHIYRPEHNLGRASIRNRLAKEAKGEWLLFIDSVEICPNVLDRKPVFAMTMRLLQRSGSPYHTGVSIPMHNLPRLTSSLREIFFYQYALMKV